ncbi:hypothetical protein LguiA_008529 [Lonicera macranthoides]
MADLLVPEPFKSLLTSVLDYVFYPWWSNNNLTTAKIEEKYGMEDNEVFEAAERYLRNKIDPSTKYFKVHKTHRQKELSTSIESDMAITDTFEEFDVTWTLKMSHSDSGDVRERYFELSFDKKFYDQVLKNYLPFIVDKARVIRETKKIVKLSYSSYNQESIDMDHPATFETLVMDPVKKKELIDDLETFKKRENYYKRIGRAWKRGYLLHGPPGTGKSSLIAAMANYLKYDVYELELMSLTNNSDFRQTLLSTGNRSIIVIEDIDCSAAEVQVQDRQQPSKESSINTRWTLSGLLNFLDGLWSSCGDEKIFVFTTNHKDRLDPALLRPGRIDMQIYMSYCEKDGFRSLAHNYLDINGGDHDSLFTEIESLITKVDVTPAEVSGELMRSENVDIALEGLVKFLKDKEKPIRGSTEEEEEKKKR